jgi:SAM-dependent methyltransferase
MYATDDLPWDSGHPDPSLVEAVRAGLIAPGRTLDIGCGLGTDARFLASRGFDVVGVDIAPNAIEKARARPDPGRCRFEALDFMAADPPGAPFDVVYDRGCWHVFDEPEERAAFAAKVAALLAPGGRWLSLIGSTEGPARPGPPRRSARDIAAAIEPVLEIRELRATEFDLERLERPKAWLCLARRRDQ